MAPVITESPLESSSAAASASDAPEHTVFANFFRVSYLVAYECFWFFGECFCYVNLKFGFS